MALTRHTRTKVGIREIPLYGQGQLIKMGLPYPATFTNYNVTNRWVGTSREASYPGSVAYFDYYYGYVDWNATVSGGGITASTSGQMKSDRKTSKSDAQYWANSNNPSGVSFAVGSTYPISGGSTPQGKVETYEEEYYTGKVTVKKCLDNGALTTVSETDYDAGVTVNVPIPSAYSNSVLAGVTIDGGSQSTYNKNGYDVTVNDNRVIIFYFKSKVKITLAKGTGGSTITGSSTTSFTKETTSASAGGNFMAEVGATISLSATSAAGYVLATNAISSSAGSYGSINGSGGTSVSGSKVCSVATTFTVNGSQFSVTPTIVDGGAGKSSWGTAKIKEHSSSTWSTGAVVLKPNTTYDLGFDTKTADTLAAAVDYWDVGGTRCTTSFTTGATITTNVTAALYLKQTKWQLTVANGTNSSWGSVSGGGWYASGTNVTIRFSPTIANIAPVAYQVNYNGSTSSCTNTATITTTNASLTATFYLKQTKFLMSVAIGSTGTDGWGTISGGGVYVGTGDKVTLKFTPTSSLVNTIHPQVDHWQVLTATPTPTPAADGSSSIEVTLGTVTANFTAYCHLASSWRKVSIRRSDSGTAGWGSFLLDASGTTTEKYYQPGTTITMRFSRATSYDTKERPQVNYIAVGTEDTIFGVDGTYTYTYQLPANVKTDLVIDCYAKQTAWPVSVTSAGHGSVTAKRINVATSAVVETATATPSAAKTVYLRYGNDEYLAMSSTPDAHYKFSAFNRTNLKNYGGSSVNYQLTSAANATVAGTFTRSDFKVTASSDLATVCDVYMQDGATAEAYYDINVANNPVVVCKIKAAYADQYKVTTFTIGSQAGVEAQYNSAADLYYVEVSNRSDVTVTAHVVPTNFNLSVNVNPTNKAQFGRVILSANGQELKDLSVDRFDGKIREGTHISVVFYQKYGGRVLTIQPSQVISNPVITDYGIEFDMPSGDCWVSVTLGAKETYQLTVGVRNLAAGQAANIPGVVKVVSRTYPDTVIGETSASGGDKTFTVYKDEEYSLVVTPASDFLSKRYAFIGWRDASGQIPGAVDTTLNILNTTEGAVSRFAGYNARENGTITIEWAKKVNDEIIPLAETPTNCSLAILNDQDKYDETHWLVGSDIVIPYEVKGSAYDQDGDAYKWTPVQVDVALAGDDYGTPNATWDDDLLTQDGSFRMLGSMKVRVVLTQTHVAGYTVMHVGYRQSTALMGEVSVFSTAMDAYTQDSTGATVLAQKERKAVIMAAPRPGFAFAGWFTLNEGVWTAVEGAKAVYEIPYVTSPMTVYYAQFVASTLSNVKQWNGDMRVAKTCEWQSKVYVGSQFFQLSSCRVYADAYPVTLKIMMSSSPDGVFGERAHTAEITITNQDPRRLPRVRPEKYFAFRVTGYARINHVGIASSMEALK